MKSPLFKNIVKVKLLASVGAPTCDPAARHYGDHYICTHFLSNSSLIAVGDDVKKTTHDPWTSERERNGYRRR